METLVLIIHVVLAVVLIALILLQQGKGADAGASFGSGASQTVFGGKGSSGFLVKLTSIVAVILLVTSITLDIMTRHKAERITTGGLPVPVAEKSVPTPSVPATSTDVPQVQQSKPSSTESSANVPTVKKPAKQDSGKK